MDRIENMGSKIRHKNAPSKPLRDLVSDAVICHPLLDFALLFKKQDYIHSIRSQLISL